MDLDVRSALAAFDIRGDFVSIEPYGSGHINDTFAATYSQGGTQVRYLLQRVNHEVFKQVEQLMDNVSRVCAHARRKLVESGAADASRRTLTLIPTRTGQMVHRDGSGLYWRVYVFIEDAVGYDIIEDEQQAYQAARTFGSFQRLLADLPGDRLYETIPNFHNTPHRYAAFEEALAADAHNRAAEARAEIDWALQHRELAGALLDLHSRGLIPERVTHNDTKLNNVLIDKDSQEGVCVIDLDTVMPGLSLYDFGDLVRTSTSPVAEDEPDASKVTMQMPMFQALARGFLDGAGDALTPDEIAAFPLGGMVITMTVGLRFLTDFLQGDVYFKTHRPNHNLERCRTQFALVDSIAAQRDAMDAYVRSIVDERRQPACES